MGGLAGRCNDLIGDCQKAFSNGLSNWLDFLNLIFSVSRMILLTQLILYKSMEKWEGLKINIRGFNLNKQ